ncbi:hypothetical protein GGI35DRAFT_210763 [Trichoderma velutinum]
MQSWLHQLSCQLDAAVICNISTSFSLPASAPAAGAPTRGRGWSQAKGDAARVPEGTLTACTESQSDVLQWNNTNVGSKPVQPSDAQKVAFCLSLFPPLSLPLLFVQSNQISPVSSLSPCLALNVASGSHLCRPLLRTWTELCLGALLVHALTLLTLCRYHLRGVQLASVVPHHLHLLRAWASKNAPSTKVYEQSSSEKGKTEHCLFIRGRTVRIQDP